MKRTLLTTLLTLFAAAAFAQKGGVTATVVDADTGESVVGAVLTLTPVKTPEKKQYFTSAFKGAVSIPSLAYGEYSLSVAFLGYNNLDTTFRVSASKVSLGLLKLKPGVQIETVVKEAKALRTSQKGDTVSYNAGAFKVVADADVEGLLKKMPGITVTDGTVEAQGETVKKVFVDGKEFFGEVRTLLKEGRITEKDIEKMIRPNIATSIAFGLYDREKYVPALLEKFPAHKQTGYDVAAEGIVLLRNNGILPLAEGRKILLTGRFTEQIPRTGGSTSSSAEVLGYDNVTLTAALREVYGDAVRVVEKPSREELAAADVVLLSTGTIDVESFERPFALPKEEEAFIRTAVESNPNTIVLVNSGSGIRMGGWNERAAAVIYGWYPGQSGFTALADILSGKLSPSGKLPMTIEKEFNDSPAKGTMPAGAEFYNKAPRAYNERLIQLYDIDYKESVLVGYRWYETKGIAPLYPFGFGLSYTTFALEKPRAPKTFPADKPLKVSVTLTNTGDREGAEVVQLYVSENAPTVLRPKKELKGFRKVTLAPGKSAVVEFELDRQALAFWDTQSRGWKVNPGEYTLSLGTSSADIAATLPVTVK